MPDEPDSLRQQKLPLHRSPYNAMNSTDNNSFKHFLSKSTTVFENTSALWRRVKTWQQCMVGQGLWVNLTTGETQPAPTAELAERFAGGRGVISKIYWVNRDTKIAALHPDSPLMFMTGPLAGTGAIAGSRWFIAGKSPLLYPEQFGLGSVGGSFSG